MYTAEYMIILCEFKDNSDYNKWLYRDTVMIILELRQTIYCTGWSFYIFLILGLTSKKNYEFGWHYALLTLRKEVWKENWDIANVKHCYAQCKRIDGNSYSYRDKLDYVFIEGLMLYFSEFLVHFANVSCTCFNFHRVFFRD